MKAVEATTSLKNPQQDFKASNGEAVRFMYHTVVTILIFWLQTSPVQILGCNLYITV